MSQSKKTWNASKALRRSVDANKKVLKIHSVDERKAKKMIVKGRKII